MHSEVLRKAGRPDSDYVHGKHEQEWGSAGAGAIQSALGKPWSDEFYRNATQGSSVHLGKQPSALPPQAQDLAAGPG